MRKHAFSLSALTFTGLLTLTGGLVFFFLIRILFTLAGLAYWQKFQTISPENSFGAHHEAQEQVARNLLQQAIRYDQNHPEYVAQFGGFLLDLAITRQRLEYPGLPEDTLFEAETWLKRAIMLDPADQWNYYQLGRLYYQYDACNHIERREDIARCPAAQFFLLALEHAPIHPFLWRTAGKCFYQRNPDFTLDLLQQMITDVTHTPQHARRELSRLLYALELNFQSDQIYESLVEPDRARELSTSCQPLEKENGIECGNDDGSPEWRTFLTSETSRVRKVLCLPEHFEQYDDAVLKIFMNHGGEGNFITNIFLNEHLIKTYNYTVPYIATWHEIPFDIQLLRGQRCINVYIRVQGATQTQNCLQVWGDADTPTTQSVYNLDETEDLSLLPGKQTGEFLIRLVLKTHKN